MHSGHAYLEFDKLATKIHQTLKVRGVAGFGFSSEDVQERIVQRANEVLLVPFVNSFQATRCNESTGSPARSLSIDGLQFSVDILSGRLAFNARQKLKCWKEFLLGWLKVLIYSLPGRGCRLTGKNTGRVCLLYGVGKENIVVEGNDSRFAAFLASTAVSPIRDARLIVVESNERLISTAPGRIQYARDPLLEVWRLSRPKGIGFLRFAFSHCMMPIALLRESFRTPELMAISRDAAYLHLIECMQKNRLIESVVYTSSNFLAQPLWLRGFRNFSTHMVHYSQAWQVFDYQEDSRHSEYPQMRWVRFDEHWVWTKGFATYLADRDRNATIHVVGPIVWHQPIALRTPHEGIVIAAFDVPALTAAAARSGGELTNFWKAENLQAFIEDLVKLRNSCKKEIGGPVRLILKAKRFHPDYDQDYASYIRQKCSEKQLELVAINTNIFQFLSGCDVAVVFPFSSPAYVAQSMKIPAIYHDPTGSLLPNFETAEGIHFSSGYENLSKCVRAILQKTSGFNSVAVQDQFESMQGDS